MASCFQCGLPRRLRRPDVQTLNWTNSSDICFKRITMEDHCAYMFTAHAEGNAYSGSLQCLLNCYSVLLGYETK